MACEGDMSRIRVMCSGGFDPLTLGHVEHFESAKRLGSRLGDCWLVVAVNSDEFLMRKKGWVCMPFFDRVKIVQALRCVDEVVKVIDKDQYVCETLRMVRPDIFAEGGDRTIDNVPKEEKDICAEIGGKIVCGVNGCIRSSSEIIYSLAENLSNRTRLKPVSRAEAESAVPIEDCSGRKYGVDEREDIIRYLLLGAEMQRGDIVFRPQS